MLLSSDTGVGLVGRRDTLGLSAMPSLHDLSTDDTTGCVSREASLEGSQAASGDQSLQTAVVVRGGSGSGSVGAFAGANGAGARACRQPLDDMAGDADPDADADPDGPAAAPAAAPAGGQAADDAEAAAAAAPRPPARRRARRPASLSRTTYASEITRLKRQLARWNQRVDTLWPQRTAHATTTQCFALLELGSLLQQQEAARRAADTSGAAPARGRWLFDECSACPEWQAHISEMQQELVAAGGATSYGVEPLGWSPADTAKLAATVDPGFKDLKVVIGSYIKKAGHGTKPPAVHPRAAAARTAGREGGHKAHASKL